MCQCQLSSVELASGAAIPPCAATVWDRVGNTFDRTATFMPARASSSDARMPEPPAPTTTASNLLTGSGTRLSPQDLDGPADVARDDEQHHRLECQAQAGRLNVIHDDVAHADP